MEKIAEKNFMQNSWISQGKNLLKLAVGGVVGFFAIKFFTENIIPTLVGFVWGTTQLLIGGVVLFALVYIFVIDGRVWRYFSYLYEALLKVLFGWLVDFDEFIILEKQIDEKEEDRNKLKKEGDKLKAQEVNMKTGLSEQEREMKEKINEIKTLQERFQETQDEQDNIEIQLAHNAFVRSKEYIDTVTPYYIDIKKLVEFAEKAYMYSGYAIKNAKSDLAMQKSIYNAVSASSNAMSSAMRAFAGNPQTNKDAEFALNRIRVKVSDKVASIHSAIKITNDYVRAIEIKDATKAKMASDMMANFNIEKEFKYIPENVSSMAGNPLISKEINTGGTSNRYMDLMKKKS